MHSLFSWLTCRFRGGVELELEVIALRHQLAVLRRQRPRRSQLFSIDRLIWVWLYRLWPRFLKVIVVVKPSTVIQWHRQGFRLYWHWRSKSGRPAVNRGVRDLIRQRCNANTLWGAPRIHGELLKLGIEVSQATVAKYMMRRRGRPSPTWRSLLRNEAFGIAAIDMFMVPSATFRLLFVMLILAHDRRKIVRFDVTQHPTADWLSRQLTEVFRPPHYLQRTPFAARPFVLRGLLPPHPDPSIARQGLSALASGPAAAERPSHRASASRWVTQSLRTPRCLTNPI